MTLKKHNCVIDYQDAESITSERILKNILKRHISLKWFLNSHQGLINMCLFFENIQSFSIRTLSDKFSQNKQLVKHLQIN